MAEDKPIEIQCDCDYCKQQAREKLLKGVGEFIAGAVVTSLVVEGALLAAPFLLGAAGFGKATETTVEYWLEVKRIFLQLPTFCVL